MGRLSVRLEELFLLRGLEELLRIHYLRLLLLRRLVLVLLDLNMLLDGRGLLVGHRRVPYSLDHSVGWIELRRIAIHARP
jgi:hypothetical protein